MVLGQTASGLELRGCTTTTIEGHVEYAPLPSSGNKPYLMEKAEYASRFPRLTVKKLLDGGISKMELKQLVMSGLIRADEYRRDFLWDYKAEVSFDMTSIPPKPFLSTSFDQPGQTPDPMRRHSLFPFPAGRVKGFMRRPDVIIVKDRAVRWPGQAGVDHQGVMHPDNLERLVEVKFPNDHLSRSQAQAYELIAGSPNRFSVLEINDCRDDDDRELDHQYNKAHQPTGQFDSLRWPSLLPSNKPEHSLKPAPVPVPVYGPEPTLRPAYIESWTLQFKPAVDSLLEQGAQGILKLSRVVQQHLVDATTWLSGNGDWVRRESQRAWEWVSETGTQVVRWTDEQLRGIWKGVQHYTDLSLETLRQIDWMQVLIDLGTAAATVVVVFAIGASLVAAGIPAIIVAGFLVLIRLAQISWALLVTVIGGAAVTVGINAG